MGIDIDRFPDKHSVIDSLICTICTDVVEDPVQTPCEHCFCKSCITQWLQEGQGSCPVDRQVLSFNGLKPLNRMTMQVLNKLNVYCKNHSKGCVLMATFENLPKLIKHESEGCEVTENERSPDRLVTQEIEMSKPVESIGTK